MLLAKLRTILTKTSHIPTNSLCLVFNKHASIGTNVRCFILRGYKMSDDLSSRFWERVDSIRTISLKELAEAIQVDYNVMIAQKAMNRIPRIDELCRYAHALSTSLEWLVSGRESETLFAGNLLANLDSRLSTIINAVIQADSEVLSEIERILNI